LAVAPLSESHLLESADDDLYDALHEVWLLRPFLGVSRAEISAYADSLGLTPRQDASNSDVTFFRNRLRHEVIPLLEELNPQLRAALSRSAHILQADYEMIETTVIQTAARLVEWDDIPSDDDQAEVGEVAYVDRHDFLRLSVGLQRHLLRHIILDLLPIDLPFAQVEQARRMIAQAQVGAELHLPEQLTLSIGYDEFLVYYGGPLPFPRYIPCLRERQSIPLDVEEELQINGHFRFYSYRLLDGFLHDLARADPLEATLAIPPDAELNLRTRRPGDRFAPMGMAGHHQKLADVFTNLKVPRPFRDRIPLLTVNDEIAWFVAPTLNGLQGRVAESYAVRPDSESALRVRWEAIGERLTEWSGG
jgi:tRNA(Ile)-lysidine synthase